MSTLAQVAQVKSTQVVLYRIVAHSHLSILERVSKVHASYQHNGLDSGSLRKT